MKMELPEKYPVTRPGLRHLRDERIFLMADFVRLSRNYSSSPRRFGHERRQEAIGIVADGDRDAGVIGCRVIQCRGYGSFDLRTVVRSTGVYDARKKRGRPIRRAGRIVVNGKI